MTTVWQRFSCEDALPRLYHYIDKELSLDELQAVSDHLNGCGSCAYEAGVRLKLKQIVREACLEAAPQSLKDRVAARISQLAGTSETAGGLSAK
jgi:mycothiol system anti-sigma-R factor